MKAHENKQNAKAFPDLHIGQEILYIMTKHQWLPEKFTQLGP